MKDQAPFSQGRFPCASSAACLRWLEYLTLSDSPGEQPLFDLSQEDRQQVARVQQHLPTCLSCMALVYAERAWLAQQRATLRHWLQEAEQQVPSTMEHILFALHHDPQPEASLLTPEMDVGGMLSPWPQQNHERKHLSLKYSLRTTFALAAAVILMFTGFGIFHQMTIFPLTSPAAKMISPLLSTSPLNMRPLTPDWGSLVLTQRSSDDKNLLVENYDPFRKRSVSLLPACCSLNTVVDGISHAGDDLLYHVFSSKSNQTWYHLLSSQTFAAGGMGGNAIWSTDDRVIYTFVGHYLLQYAVQQRSLRQLPFSLPVSISRLQFYYQHYLYFSSTQNNGSIGLYRVNLATGHLQLLVNHFASSTAATTFWLSPSGRKIYYVTTVSGVDTVFACNTDGSNPRTVVTHAVPVGYAADNTLITLRSEHGMFQLVRLSSMPMVLVADLAPGAQALSSQDVALAPYGSAVVVAAHYPDGSVQLWSTDLRSLKQQVILRLSRTPQTMPVRLIGWDRLRVS